LRRRDRRQGPGARQPPRARWQRDRERADGPRHHGRAVAVAEAERPPMHLLLVEDDPRLQRVLRRLLEDDRHVVEVAPDGRTALELVEATSGIETVILDVGLPDISGLDVARRLRKDGRDLTILMLTARDTVNDRVSGLDAGADDYLVKPFAYEELSARLRALARRSEPGARRP